jgi:hypothetical protein
MGRAIVAGFILLSACGSDPPVITSLTVSPASAPRGTDVTVSLTVKNFTIRRPEAGGHALRAAHDSGEAEDGDYPDGGHFQVYLDTTESSPMFIDCPEYCEHGAPASTARARIPDDATIADHIVIVRLYNDHGEVLDPEVRASTSLTVTTP